MSLINDNRAEFHAWFNMKRRCYNPKEVNYKWYGGKGITVCDRWLNDFPAFLSDMGKRPSDKHSLDRIDVLGNYGPDNCRWATEKDQKRNRGDFNVRITWNGITRLQVEWSEITGLPFQVIGSRINKLGWSIDDALTVPVKNKHKSLSVIDSSTGVRYGSIREASIACGIPEGTLASYISGKRKNKSTFVIAD